MSLFHFPVNSPYGVGMPSRRLISDTPQVIDYIHEGRVERLQELFDSYELPTEAHPEAMEQFAAIAGITRDVSAKAVADMRARLVAASLSRDTDPEVIAMESSRPVSEQTVNWADAIIRLSDRFGEAADRIERLSGSNNPSERAIVAIEALGWLIPERDWRDETVLHLCSTGISLDIKAYDLKAPDFLPLLAQRKRFLHLFFSAVIRSLPQITWQYLNQQDQFEFAYMAVWLASPSDALLHTIRHLYQLPRRATLTPLPLANSLVSSSIDATMRACCGSAWGAHAARRMLRFAALEKAKERISEFDPSLQASALKQLEEYKLV